MEAHELPVSISLGLEGERVHDALGHAVGVAIADDRTAEAVALGRGLHQTADGVSDRHGGGGGGGSSPLLDEGATAGGHLGCEIVLEVVCGILACDDIGGLLAVDAGVYPVRHLHVSGVVSVHEA